MRLPGEYHPGMKMAITDENGRTWVIAREAAAIVGCTMGNLRHHAKNGTIRVKTEGPRARYFDFEDLLALKAKSAEGGHRPPGGFVAN